MISVQNRLQPLSGNNILYYSLLFFIVMSSCSSARQSVQQTTQRDTSTLRENKTEATADKNIKRVDTLKWTAIPDELSKPITVPENKKDLPFTKGKELDILVAMPLGADSYVGTGMEDERYLQYYAGMKLAFDQLEKEGYLLNINIIDASSTKITQDLVKNQHIIFAPNDKDQLSNLIEWTAGKNIKVVSPWYSNSRTAENAPHYIQLKANLREHFDKMIFHAASNFPANEMVIVGRDNRGDKQWVTYLQSSYKRMFPDAKESPAELLLLENKLNSGEPVFQNAILNNGKVFLFPHYSIADENFMFQALKRLSSEREEGQVVVYGMPLIIESEIIGFDIYNALNIRVITPEFLDVENSAVKRFSQEFYHKFNTIPEKDAFDAYDKTLYAIKNLTLDEKEWNQNNSFQTYLLTSFEISPVILNENKSRIDFYENKHLFVLEFINGNFTRLYR